MATQPSTTADFKKLVQKLGWKGVQSQGIKDPSTGSNDPKVVGNLSAIGMNAGAYDPSGTLTMGGGLGTASGPEADSFNRQQAMISAAANNFVTDGSGIITGLNGQAAVNAAYPDATADPQYQLQLAQLANSLAGYQTNQQLALNQYDDQIGENLKRMGWNNATKGWDAEGQGSYGQDFRNNEGDFASRGAFYSGPHIIAQSDLNSSYNNQKNDMDNARARFAQGQNQQLSQVQSQNSLAKQDALTQAVARIAAQQGIDFNKVPGANTLTALK